MTSNIIRGEVGGEEGGEEGGGEGRRRMEVRGLEGREGRRREGGESAEAF